VTVKFVGDPLSERMIRIEEQNKYLSAQIAELKVSSGDFVFEDIRIENKIRKLVKPESLR
jgi:hypothetical protein